MRSEHDPDRDIHSGRLPGLDDRQPAGVVALPVGAQPLYTLGSSVAQGSTSYNTTSETFGIRTVTST